MTPPPSRPSNQIEFLPRTRQPKRPRSALTRRSSGSSARSSSGTGSASSSTSSQNSTSLEAPSASRASSSERRPRDSLVAFKSSDSFGSLHTLPRRLGSSSSPRCVSHKAQRSSLSVFKVSKPVPRVVETGEGSFNPFEYFPPWCAARGIWWGMKWCVGAVKFKRRKC
ncbi:hypothetical protein T440DRAFT_145740 [Plenodomus tracheiphilus IPT5]|uniref:Uncharacterized protein n=1 Tax=Plenodomus tracheiphilus IPT5 TaxID=1408161 RepID=A0A6A7B2V1_9PLEO|nr:hypothetical protein T440DRAFT_145740 [Plenodomus tracheiphilus IPT5]